MTAKEILALSMSGYNSQQIAVIAAEMAAQPADPAPAPAADPAPAPVADPAPASAADPAPAPAADPAMLQLDGLMAKLDALTNQLQQQAILASQQPATQTADDILASIINPPKAGTK